MNQLNASVEESTHVTTGEKERLYYQMAFRKPDCVELLKEMEKPEHFGETICLSEENATQNYDDRFSCSACWQTVNEPWVTAHCCGKCACKACLDWFQKMTYCIISRQKIPTISRAIWTGKCILW
jgi:hypothetical protein